MTDLLRYANIFSFLVFAAGSCVPGYLCAGRLQPDLAEASVLSDLDYLSDLNEDEQIVDNPPVINPAVSYRTRAIDRLENWLAPIGRWALYYWYGALAYHDQLWQRIQRGNGREG